MYQPPGVKTSPDLPVPDLMKAWVLGDPDQLHLRDKPTPAPSRAEVLASCGLTGQDVARTVVELSLECAVVDEPTEPRVDQERRPA